MHVPSKFLTEIIHRHLVLGTSGSQMPCTHNIFSGVVINENLYFVTALVNSTVHIESPVSVHGENNCSDRLILVSRL